MERFNTPSFVSSDPVQFPRAYTNKRDVEVAAFFASTIAWGNRTQIINNCRVLFDKVMNNRPYDFVMNGGWAAYPAEMNIHRTFFMFDAAYICKGLAAVYKECDSLEHIFTDADDVWQGFNQLRDIFKGANNGRESRHISNPNGNAHKAGSACKRLNLMLRWLCRQDGIVDLGIWNNVSPGKLMMPLDVHVARLGRDLGLITRKGNDRKAVEEITRNLACFDPADPCKYDFALFGLGVTSKLK